MKIRHYLIGLLAIVACMAAAQTAQASARTSRQPQESQRRIINLNREWIYKQGDPADAASLSCPTKDWERIGLPHSFSIPYFMSKEFYTGYGWYRKQIALTREECGRQVFLEFDGVFQEAEIFVNEHRAGYHAGGYTGFSVDITPYVKAGDNLVAVRVNNLWKADIAPRGGEHVFSGGIYRNVRLVLKPTVHIDWYGTFVTTPDLAAQGGNRSSVHIQTDIRNASDKRGSYRLHCTVTDAAGAVVGSAERLFQIEAHSVRTINQATEPIAHPALWHPSQPSLYKVVNRLYEEERLLDEEETTFGFRWFEWTADRGFFLNGEHLYFRGANVHQDQAGWGDAVTESAMRRDVSLMKEAGFDLIRGSHYPHAPAFSQACDEMGMLFWSEAPFWGTAGAKTDGFWTASAYPIRQEDQEAFEENVLQQLGEMIRIHRNHPSIVIWSMGNEAFFSTSEAMPGVRRLLQRMVEQSHRLDPTRPAGVGGVQRPLGAERIDLIGDVAGYNGDGSTIADFQQPPVPNVVSEYGSTTADRPGAYSPGWGDLERDEGWKGRPWRSGQAIWCGFDHGSIFGSGLGKMGIVDYFRIPKRSWYWYRNEYTGIRPPQWPAAGEGKRLRLEASQCEGVRTDGTDDVQLIVTVFDAAGCPVSATPVVTLRLLSGPGEFPTGRSIRFDPESDIRILDGQAAIAFRSYYAGTSVIEATSPGLEPARITVSFEGAERYEAGKTPETPERPYVPFHAPSEQEEMQTFGCNNPTFASSSARGHSAGCAADGDRQTWWQPDTKKRDACWTVDTERVLSLHGVRIIFARPGNFRYRMETSVDGHQWQPLSDSRSPHQAEEAYTLPSGKERRVRFIRLTFPAKDMKEVPQLLEVEATGRIAEAP